MKFRRAERLKRLPPYLFVKLEKTVEEARRKGIDMISFGVGDPDLPPPDFILEELKKEASDPGNHNYSFSKGSGEYRDAVSEWYRDRFKVKLDPDREVTALIGSKEGLANMARGYVNQHDKVLVPEPAYPVYKDGAVVLSDGTPVVMPLLAENDFKPVLTGLDYTDVKMMYLNYPNNPTGAVVKKEFLKELVDIARDEKLIVCYDNAYSEIYFEDCKPPSILEVEGAFEVAVEFHSCSKTFNMTGDRIGFAVGNSDLIKGLVEVKSQIDSGPSSYIQKVAAKALRGYTRPEVSAEISRKNAIYQERRDVLVDGLNELGINCMRPKATFYVWVRCGGSSLSFTDTLLKANIVVTPGIGFGGHGEGYVRFALTIPKERIEEALERLSSISFE